MLVDEKTYERFLLAEKTAKKLGLPLIEVLDRAELLLTRERRHSLQVEAMRQIDRRLDLQAPNKLMSYYYQRGDGTSAEMFAALQQWVEVIVRRFEDGTLEDL